VEIVIYLPFYALMVRYHRTLVLIGAASGLVGFALWMVAKFVFLRFIWLTVETVWLRNTIIVGNLTLTVIELVFLAEAIRIVRWISRKIRLSIRLEQGSFAIRFDQFE
jgi:hypothetical protein